MHVQVTIRCDEEDQEMLIAGLLGLEFDSFFQVDQEVSAYIEEEKFNADKLNELLETYFGPAGSKYEVSPLEDKNWNDEWEKNFDPVFVDDRIVVKASFHKIKEKFPYEILIDPKMSFGTGHHETTSLMLKNQLSLPHKEKVVLDAGTGTGILAIMAAKLGARKIIATDIDEWSIDNSQENFALNSIQNIEIKKGGVEELHFSETFDIVLANITRNVLLHDIPYFAQLLNPGGQLLLSGFYEDDIPLISEECERHNLRLCSYSTKNSWACLMFEK